MVWNKEEGRVPGEAKEREGYGESRVEVVVALTTDETF